MILLAHILDAHKTLLSCISSIGIALSRQTESRLPSVNSFPATVQDHRVGLIFLSGSDWYLIAHVTSAHIA